MARPGHGGRRRALAYLGEPRLRILARLQARDHDQAGALDGAHGLTQPARGHQLTAAPEIGAVEEHDVEIALETPVRERVVHEHQTRTARGRGARQLALAPARE